MNAVMEFLFPFAPDINLCIAFAIIPGAFLLGVGFIGEGIKSLRIRRRRNRRWSR